MEHRLKPEVIMPVYPHTVKITKTVVTGSADELNPIPVTQSVVVYEGEADIQDDTRSLRRAKEVSPSLDADAVCFLPCDVSGIPLDAEVETMLGSTPGMPKALVKGRRSLDNTLILKFIQ